MTNYGLSAEIDTCAGAWKDDTGTGWKHQTDIGLIKSDFDGLVRLNLTTLGSFNNNFGVTVFTGMDDTTTVTIHIMAAGITLSKLKQPATHGMLSA